MYLEKTFNFMFKKVQWYKRSRYVSVYMKVHACQPHWYETHSNNAIFSLPHNNLYVLILSR